MIIYQQRIYRNDLRRNPEVLYVFGDNLGREGMGGQAYEMRGEPNAVGVATKRAPTHNVDDFFTDADYEEVIEIIEDDLEPVHEALADGRVVIYPMDGIGTGLSELPHRAPKIYAHLVELGLGAQYS